jgi:hypothetical protein
MFPDNIVSQAIKPRGNDANEKIVFLSDWYAKTASNVKAGDPTQKELIDLTDEYTEPLTKLKRSTPEETREAIAAFLPTVESRYKEATTTGSKLFFAYLYIELSRVIV